jgi:hypothetical protein
MPYEPDEQERMNNDASGLKAILSAKRFDFSDEQRELLLRVIDRLYTQIESVDGWSCRDCY